MEQKVNRRRFVKLTGIAGMAAVAGCSGGGPDTTDDGNAAPDTETPTEPETTTEPEPLPDPTETDPLVEPATLREWQDAGIVNMNETGDQERAVILRVGDTDAYEDGHVPGAIPWEATAASRVEGLAEVAPMVPNGPTMDDIFQRAGVCSKTSIVLSAPIPLRAARAYWTLRYWGFPRERAKVLNGGYTSYEEKYDLEEGAEPAHPTTAFSVQDNEQLHNDRRLGMAQMIQRVDLKHEGERDDVFIDNRPDPGAKIATALVDDPANYIQGPKYSSDAPWKSADEIADHFWGMDGVEEGDTFVTYCGSGYRAAMGFFALDGILGHENVAVYDGSFSKQWTHYDENADPVPNDNWRVDIADRTDGPTGESSLDFDPELNEKLTDLTSPDANQIERDDLKYMAGGDGGDAGDGGDFGCGSALIDPAPHLP